MKFLLCVIALFAVDLSSAFPMISLVQKRERLLQPNLKVGVGKHFDYTAKELVEEMLKLEGESDDMQVDSKQEAQKSVDDKKPEEELTKQEHVQEADEKKGDGDEWKAMQESVFPSNPQNAVNNIRENIGKFEIYIEGVLEKAETMVEQKVEQKVDQEVEQEEKVDDEERDEIDVANMEDSGRNGAKVNDGSGLNTKDNKKGPDKKEKVDDEERDEIDVSNMEDSGRNGAKVNDETSGLNTKDDKKRPDSEEEEELQDTDKELEDGGNKMKVEDIKMCTGLPSSLDDFSGPEKKRLLALTYNAFYLKVDSPEVQKKVAVSGMGAQPEKNPEVCETQLYKIFAAEKNGGVDDTLEMKQEDPDEKPKEVIDEE